MNAIKSDLRPAVVLATHTMGLGVIRALGRMGVPIVAVYYDRKDMGYTSRYVREKVEAPHPETEEMAFLDLLMRLGRRFSGSVLFPVSDETLKMVSRFKGVLEEDFIVACPDWKITQKIIEKRFTYALADQIGVPAPKTLLPDSLEAVERYSREASYPCLVKPVESHVYFARFHTKMVKARNAAELITAYRQAAAAGLSVVLQELIPGGDATGRQLQLVFLGRAAPGGVHRPEDPQRAARAGFSVRGSQRPGPRGDGGRAGDPVGDELLWLFLHRVQA